MSASVLVVEDDAPTREMIAALLEDEGYHVRTAADGAHALGLLRGWRPDAIVLDVAMPGVDAVEFRAVQVGIPGAGDVPVLLTSATRVGPRAARARPRGRGLDRQAVRRRGVPRDRRPPDRAHGVRFLLVPVCWVLGRGRERGLHTFGRTLARCPRCGVVRAR